MKVLDVVHSLEVKDIRTFVEWLKTFRVEYDGGGKNYDCLTQILWELWLIRN